MARPFKSGWVWHLSRAEQLATYIEEGRSSSEIARAFNELYPDCSITKNTIISAMRHQLVPRLFVQLFGPEKTAELIAKFKEGGKKNWESRRKNGTASSRPTQQHGDKPRPKPKPVPEPVLRGSRTFTCSITVVDPHSQLARACGEVSNQPACLAHIEEWRNSQNLSSLAARISERRRNTSA